MPMAVTQVEVEARGLVFDGLVDGPAGGELVLLLHGFPQSAAIWRPALRTLAAAGYRAVAIDQRGYGRRARPSRVEAYRLDEPVEDAVAVAAALGRPRFHVVGHDWGGVVAWAL
ncbi:MAG: alpha/beta fold hydrolase, partial [Candidatus Dormibacteraeota bacterium]|nr:alpha/beta fold hydrolase [Candidatus Dormibacteraeota bacterium]